MISFIIFTEDLYFTEAVMRERLNRFMAGRYGVDELSRFMLYLSLFLMLSEIVLGFFSGNAVIAIISHVVNLVALIIIILNMLRMFSRNHTRQYKINQWFLRTKGRITGLFKGNHSSVDKTKKVFKCPKCSQRVRVPRGRGRIEITCPKCKTRFIKKT